MTAATPVAQQEEGSAPTHMRQAINFDSLTSECALDGKQGRHKHDALFNLLCRAGTPSREELRPPIQLDSRGCVCIQNVSNQNLRRGSYEHGRTVSQMQGVRSRISSIEQCRSKPFRHGCQCHRLKPIAQRILANCDLLPSTTPTHSKAEKNQADGRDSIPQGCQVQVQ